MTQQIPAGYDIVPGSMSDYEEAYLALQERISGNDRAYQDAQARLREAELALQRSEGEAERHWALWLADNARAHEARLAALDRDLRRELAQLENQMRARETELRLATSPIDFVAYEKYRRQLAMEGPAPPYKSPSTDAELQAMMAGITGREAQLEPGQRLLGEFGVTIPTAQGYTRAGFQEISPNEQAILSSFLKAGLKTPAGTSTAIDPEEYFRKIQESFVPTLPQAGPIQYNY